MLSFGAFGTALSVVSASRPISAHSSLIGYIKHLKCYLESPSLNVLVNDWHFWTDPQLKALLPRCLITKLRDRRHQIDGWRSFYR